MSRDSEGRIPLSPRSLVLVVVAALALGSGGSFAGSFFTGPGAQVADHETRLSVVERVQQERDRELERRLVSIETALRDIERAVRHNPRP